MSMTYIGRLVNNLKEFYTEINGATLTGAIDVVVVEQQDGSYTCSPFHVRFGKLGVLRSREKVVDIEINGEPRDIHMKLGDSGEAFFVEEVSDTETEDIPEYLATSPIPVSHFEELYNAQGRRRNSIDMGEKKPSASTLITNLENEVFDYTKRRYTADDDNQKVRGKDFITRQIQLGNIERSDSFNDESHATSTTSNMATIPGGNSCDTIFPMDDVSPSIGGTPRAVSPGAKVSSAPAGTPGTNAQSTASTPEEAASKSQEMASTDENKDGGQKARRRRRKKSSMNGKKKTHQRKSSNVTSSTVDSSTSELMVDAKSSDSNTDRSSLEGSKSESDPKDNAQLVTASEEMPSSIRKVSTLDPDFHFFSDTELTTNQANSRPGSPSHITSDTEFEVQKSKEGQETNSQSWEWGEFPKNMTTSTSTEMPKPPGVVNQEEHNSMLSNVFSFMKQNKHGQSSAVNNEGIYLSDLSSVDPQTASRYFSSYHSYTKTIDMDCESGNGPSLAQSPNSAEGAKSIDSEFDEHDKLLQSYNQNISISMCGWEPAPTPERFLQHVIPFSDLCNDPTLLESDSIVVRIKQKYFTWKVAAPIMCSLMIYQRPLPQSSVDQLVNIHMPSANNNNVATAVNIENKEQQKPENRSWMWMWRRSRGSRETTPGTGPAGPEIVEKEEKIVVAKEEVILKIEAKSSKDAVDNKKAVEETKETPETPTVAFVSSEKCRKTLRLNSEQIAKLNLQDGMNEVVFSVTTAYQGTSRCTCNLYKWRWDDKIVISDIDGTITKSDVLGHILPIVGADWAQTGVAQLFNKIKNNGYKLMYLSARAIGQARTTREYLKSIKQEDISMPDGPILLNPTSLITAFHREVIEKKPEQFKISCMSDIKALFPTDSNPFYAGYGNRINDVWAYTAVGIPIVRIFTINSRGELKHELTQTFQSSYANMSVIVDQLFPHVCDAANDYSQFVYWRDPLPTIDELPAIP